MDLKEVSWPSWNSPQLQNYKCNAMKYIWRKYKVQYITCSIAYIAGGGQVNLIRSVDQNLTLVLS